MIPSRLPPGTRVRYSRSDELGTVVEPGPFCEPTYTPVEFNNERAATFQSTWNVRTDQLEVIEEDEDIRYATESQTKETDNEHSYPFGWDLPPGCTQRHIDEAFVAEGLTAMQDDIFKLLDGYIDQQYIDGIMDLIARGEQARCDAEDSRMVDQLAAQYKEDQRYAAEMKALDEAEAKAEAAREAQTGIDDASEEAHTRWERSSK